MKIKAWLAGLIGRGEAALRWDTSIGDCSNCLVVKALDAEGDRDRGC